MGIPPTPAEPARSHLGRPHQLALYSARPPLTSRGGLCRGQLPWRKPARIWWFLPVFRPQPIQPSNGRFYSLQPPPPGPATQGGSLAARGPPQGRSGSRAPAHPCAAGRGGQGEVTSPHRQGGGGVGGAVPAAGALFRMRRERARLGADFAKNSCFCPATREGGRQKRCRILKARRSAA